MSMREVGGPVYTFHYEVLSEPIIRFVKDSNNLHILEVDKGFILIAQDTYRDTKFKADFLMKYMDNSSSMWDGSNFAIFSKTRDVFDMLVEAEKNNDLAVGLFGDFSKLNGDKGVYVIVNSLNE